LCLSRDTSVTMVNIRIMDRAIIKSRDGSWSKTNTLAVTMIKD
jgi:hypothetical protein